MDLERDKRQNIQKKLDFSSERKGEARQAGREETESRQAMHEPESPANTIPPSSQSRQIDGAGRETCRGQAAVKTHSGVPERRSDGEWVSQSKRGGNSPRGSNYSSDAKDNFCFERVLRYR